VVTFQLFQVIRKRRGRAVPSGLLLVGPILVHLDHWTLALVLLSEVVPVRSQLALVSVVTRDLALSLCPLGAALLHEVAVDRYLLLREILRLLVAM
jgi:hypothetical protein